MPVLHGDCLSVMNEMPAESFDSIVTDPPYALTGASRNGSARVAGTGPYARHTVGGKGFMGKTWDAAIPGADFWAAALRVAKPGAFLLSFGGTRTWHRLACAIEDAGWEIRDTISWNYGSGFPKNKACLKPAWEPIILARKPGRSAHLQIDACRIEGSEGSGHWSGEDGSDATSTPGYDGGFTKGGTKSQGRWPANVILDEEAAARLDEEVGTLTSGANPTRRGSDKFRNTYGDFAGESECVANRGIDSGGPSRFFFTATKDCGLCGTPMDSHARLSLCEPSNARTAVRSSRIIQATLASIAPDSALRLEAERLAPLVPFAPSLCDSCGTLIAVAVAEIRLLGFRREACARTLGFMGNFSASILTRSLASCAEALASTDITRIMDALWSSCGSALHAIADSINSGSHDVDRGPSRFRYCPKASRSERDAGLQGVIEPHKRDDSRNADQPSMNGGAGNPHNRGARAVLNDHPTVKPLSLMRWLVKLVTPAGGHVLDPFCGSGTTGCAAVLERLAFTGIDLERRHVEISEARIAYWATHGEPEQHDLFGETP